MQGSSRLTVVVMILAFGLGGGVRAQEEEGERLIYDGEKGEWIEQLPPEPGTERGDLEIAKRMLARGDKSSAKKAKKDQERAVAQAVKKALAEAEKKAAEGKEEDAK